MRVSYSLLPRNLATVCKAGHVVCRQLEDALDQRNAELIDLRKAALEHAVASPIKPSSHLQSALGAWGHAVPSPLRSDVIATARGTYQPRTHVQTPGNNGVNAASSWTAKLLVTAFSVTLCGRQHCGLVCCCKVSLVHACVSHCTKSCPLQNRRHSI